MTRETKTNNQEFGRRGNLSDEAYSRILEHLFDKRLPTGSFVSQNKLVKLIDIPIAPLRDALRVLEAEGVLTIHPRSGIQFVKPGLELTKSAYQFRAILELAAVRHFAETGEMAALDEMEQLHQSAIAKIEEVGMNVETFNIMEELEVSLHQKIIDVMENPIMAGSHRRVSNYMRLVRIDKILTPPIAFRSIKEHLKVIEACKKRDADAAEAALKEHFSAAMQRHLGLF